MLKKLLKYELMSTGRVFGLCYVGVLGAALLLPRLIGEWGVYIAEIMAWIGAAILLIWGYYRRMRLLEGQLRATPQ